MASLLRVVSLLVPIAVLANSMNSNVHGRLVGTQQVPLTHFRCGCASPLGCVFDSFHQCWLHLPEFPCFTSGESHDQVGRVRN